MAKTYVQSGPVARALELVGERWTILILQELLRGRTRFAQLKESVGGIAPNVLSDRLKTLEDYDVVERRFYSDHPPRAEYRLTKKGHELGIVAGVGRNGVERLLKVIESCAYRPTADPRIHGALGLAVSRMSIPEWFQKRTREGSPLRNCCWKPQMYPRLSGENEETLAKLPPTLRS